MLLFVLLLGSVAGDEMASNISTTNTFASYSCRRYCNPEEPPRFCRFGLTIETYVTMGQACRTCPVRSDDCNRTGCIPGSGTMRPIVVANRKLPGPSIEVCVGDTVRVEVVNAMLDGQSTAIHWHGIRQLGTPFMDGVPMLTQWPIPPGSSFTYEFKANEAGTFYWHSQVAQQRGDGLAGALIIRQPPSIDPQYGSSFDVDDQPPIIIQDWLPSITSAAMFVYNTLGRGDDTASMLLINGLPGTTPALTYTIKLSTSKFRHRLRIISNSYLECPVKVSLDCHDFEVISTDGHNIKPILAKTLTLTNGERFDVVPRYTGYCGYKRLFRFQAVGSFDCRAAIAIANVIYADSDVPDPVVDFSATQEVNVLKQAGEPASSGFTVADLVDVSFNESIESNMTNMTMVDMTIQVELDDAALKNSRFWPAELSTPRLNNITLGMPSVPLLSQTGDIPTEFFCNSSQRACNSTEFCECLHVVDVPLGSLVELQFVDRARGEMAGVGSMSSMNTHLHSMHLHGHSFRVVAMGVVRNGVTLEEVSKLEIKRSENGPFKDTVFVPPGGYTFVQFKADNPGVWLLHCRFSTSIFT